MKEILPSLLYFDVRSAEDLYIFFIGYQHGDDLDRVRPEGGEWINLERSPAELVQFKKIENTPDWYFSATDFNYWRSTFEEGSGWKYSGGVELLLLNLRYVDGDYEVSLDFSKVISLRIDNIKDMKVVTGVGALLERIFKYSEGPQGSDPVSGLSNYLGLSTAKESFFNAFLALFPKDIGKEMAKIATFTVSDYSKKSG